MFLIQNLKKLVYSFDMFCSSELLRYNQDTQYKTFTGGLLSLGITVVIIMGFFSMISSTLNKTLITSAVTNIRQIDPPLLNLVANEENNFMLAIGINSMNISLAVNLSGSTRYFDVVMAAGSFVNGKVAHLEYVPLEQCTKQHWRMIPSFYENFDMLQANDRLCLPIGYRLPLGGVFASPVYSLAQIQIYQCRNRSINDNCAPQQQIDNLFKSYGSFQLSYIYANPGINPSQTNYISYYLQENDYTLFSKTISSQAWLKFTDFTINTDNSILPFSSMNIQRGSIIEEKSINYACAPSDGLLASVILAKSSHSMIYNRQVQKVSAVFSYIGGLVGAVTGMLFIFKSYTDSSLEIVIGLDLFQSAKEGKESEGFNLYGYIRLTIYRLLKLLKWKGEWKIAKKFDEYQQQAVKQLDICILLKRVIMLQTYMKRLFSKHELDQIISKQEGLITLRSAKQMRSLLLKNSTGSEDIQGEEYNQVNQGPRLNEEPRLKDTGNNLVQNIQQQSSWFNIFGKQKNCNRIHNVNFNQSQLGNSHFKEGQKKENSPDMQIRNNSHMVVISTNEEKEKLKKRRSIKKNNLKTQKLQPKEMIL